MKRAVEKILLIFGILIPASCILPENTTGLVVGLFVLSVLILFFFKKISITISGYVYPFMLFFGIYLISIFYSQDIEEAKVKILIKLPILILPFFFSVCFNNVNSKIIERVLINFVFLFALSTPYFLLIALFRSLRNGSIYYTYPETGEVISTYFTYAGLTDWVIHPAYVSLWAGTAFLISMFFIYKTPRNILYWTASFSLFTLVILSQSRMNILALFSVLIAVTIGFVFRRYSLRKSLLSISVVMLTLGLFIFVFITRMGGRFSEVRTFRYDIEADNFHDGFNGITIRLAEWKCALQEIKKRPFFGSGIGDARNHLEESYKRNKFFYGYREKFNAHNQFIETTLAVGFIGLASLIYIFIPVVYKAIRSRAWHVLAAMGYIVLCFLTESYLERQWGVVFLGMMIPTLAESEIALYQKNRDQSIE